MSSSAHSSPSSSLSTSEHWEQIQAAAALVRSRIGGQHGLPAIAIVLGSGLNNFVQNLTNTVVVDYNDIPFMPMTSVKGHHGRIVCGDVSVGEHGETVRVLCFAGRVHAYEGYLAFQVNFAARLSAALGCTYYVATNGTLTFCRDDQVFEC